MIIKAAKCAMKMKRVGIKQSQGLEEATEKCTYKASNIGSCYTI